MVLKMETLTADRVKKLALGEGADLCGIAPVERFDGAPEGFRPEDIFPAAKSVVVIAKRLPEAALRSNSPMTYKVASDLVKIEVAHVTYNLSIKLQDLGTIAVPVLGEPYMYWDAEKEEGRGLLSMRHAAMLSGLGVLGRNTLLINERFGNRLTFGSLLLDAHLEGDPVANYKACSDDCNLCIKSCPARALDGKTVAQRLCRQYSQTTTPKGFEIYTCKTCRVVCPMGAGIIKKNQSG
jgi:epoxyqueuosine reductase QueG